MEQKDYDEIIDYDDDSETKTVGEQLADAVKNTFGFDIEYVKSLFSKD